MSYKQVVMKSDTGPGAERMWNEFTESVCRQVARNIKVQRKLPGGGSIYIERKLPFLVVYRRPANIKDPGTSQLLTGQASYLLAPIDQAGDKALVELIYAIVRTQASAFGGFFLMEIWAERDSPADQKMRQKPAFEIVATADTPIKLLEQLEHALLAITVAAHKATVGLTHQEAWAPPGMTSLLSSDTLHDLNCVCIGLQVRPIYRHPETGQLFTSELQALRHVLSHILRQVFYIYAHAYTRHHPAHYHELGQQTITTSVKRVDRMLAEIDEELDLLLYVTPVNTDSAWEAFKQSHFEREPVFRYRPSPVDPGLMKRRLYLAPLDHIEDPALVHIFNAKRDELDRQLTLIADRQTDRFLLVSLQLYGRIEAPLLEAATCILEQFRADNDRAPTKVVDANAFAERAEADLSRYRLAYPSLAARVEVRGDVHGVMVSHGNLLISERLTLPEPQVEATLAHEVGTHIVTYYNGSAQPLRQLKAGMANYEPLQEGLAVLSEYLIGKLSRARLRLLAGRVLAVHRLTAGASFVETFRELQANQGFSPYTAFSITMRVYRGGGFTKDAVYLRGLLALLHYLKADNDLELLYLGKIALDHIGLIEELRWRQVLKPGCLRPRYLNHPQAKERLQRLRRGATVLELVD
jgi:uncharacterized protein (TIGR02421 family)